MLTEIPSKERTILIWNDEDLFKALGGSSSLITDAIKKILPFDSDSFLKKGVRQVDIKHDGEVLGRAEESPYLENAMFSFALITLWKPDAVHYHNKGEETYVILQGDGKIFLNGKIVPIAEGTRVFIPPGVRHAAKPVGFSKELRFCCISTPHPFDPSDVIHDVFRATRW